MIDHSLCTEKTDNELVGMSIENSDHFLCLSKRYEEKLLRYIIRISKFSREDVEDLITK